MPTLFISCVSNEFASYRDAICRDLTRPNLETKIQEDFIAYGGATIEKLDEYIQNCEAVIHVCGDMTGKKANQLSIQYINNKYPDFGTRFPQLQPVLNGTADLSYTQWEAWLAVYHGKRLFIVEPTTTALRDNGYTKNSEQIAHQAEHLKWLRTLGYYPEIQFNNEDELVKNLYRSKLGDILNTIPKAKPVNLPYHSIGSNFKGRENFINELYGTLNHTTNGIIGVAIHGLGGMGKTRLAMEYAWQYKNNYTALLFVNADSPELLLTNIANLSDARILNLPENEAQDENIKYAAVINWLNQYTGWLLILDNADTIKAAEKIEKVFSELQHGHVLITSRVDNWSSQIKKRRLDVLNIEDARTFLLETTENAREKRNNDPEMVTKIAGELGCLALALEQARAYIITKESSFESYIKAWEENRVTVLSWFDKQQMQYPAGVAITWQTSFNQLSHAAITLLNRLAWLAPDPIPKTILEEEVPNVEKIDAISAWEGLKQYSLAISSADKTSFTIHRLVQDVTRSRLDKTLALQTLQEALSWMDNAFKDDPSNVDDWPKLEPLIPHILLLFEYTKKNEIGDAFNRLMNQVAILLYTKAQYIIAKPLMTRALEIVELRFGSNHPNVAIPINNLAQLLKDTNRIQEAEPLMRRVLEIYEQSFGSSHPSVAIALSNLAVLLSDTNRMQEAEPLIRRALEIDEQNFGSNDPNVAIRLNNLAQLLMDTKRYEEAEPLMRRALEIGEKSFGYNHPNVGKILSNLTQLLQETNRLQEAELLIRRALQIHEQSLGSSHPDVATDLNNLALLLQATNRLQEAESLMRRVLGIYETSLGPGHPNVAVSLNNLAQLLKYDNRKHEAEPLLKRALIILINSFGVDHPNTKTTTTNYILLLQGMSKNEEEIKAIFSTLL